MNTPHTPIISRRQKDAGPLHHLWNNHGHWWIHCTFHLPDGTARRVRASLRTRDLTAACRRRDAILASHGHADPAPATA